MPEYAALFKELIACTGYSLADLRNHFYEHLSGCIKDELVHTTCLIITLDQLVIVATDIDFVSDSATPKRIEKRDKKDLQLGL